MGLLGLALKLKLRRKNSIYSGWRSRRRAKNDLLLLLILTAILIDYNEEAQIWRGSHTDSLAFRERYFWRSEWPRKKRLYGDQPYRRPWQTPTKDSPHGCQPQIRKARIGFLCLLKKSSRQSKDIGAFTCILPQETSKGRCKSWGSSPQTAQQAHLFRIRKQVFVICSICFRPIFT